MCAGSHSERPLGHKPLGDSFVEVQPSQNETKEQSQLKGSLIEVGANHLSLTGARKEKLQGSSNAKHREGDSDPEESLDDDEVAHPKIPRAGSAPAVLSTVERKAPGDQPASFGGVTVNMGVNKYDGVNVNVAEKTHLQEELANRIDPNTGEVRRSHFQELLAKRPQFEAAIVSYRSQLGDVKRTARGAARAADNGVEQVKQLSRSIKDMNHAAAKTAKAVKKDEGQSGRDSLRSFVTYNRHGLKSDDSEGRPWVPDAGKWKTFKDLILKHQKFDYSID